MTALTLLAAALVTAANPDPGQPVKDCAAFASHYRALLERQAEQDVALARKPGDRVPPVAEHVEARTEAGQVARELTDEVASACLAASGSQYECVLTAATYDQLAACQLPELPLLARDERRELPASEPPPSPERRAEADQAVLREYVQGGRIDLEALGTGSAAQTAEAEPPPIAGEGR